MRIRPLRIFKRKLALPACMAFSILAGASLAWSAPQSPESGGKQIIKWVDEKGVTHYGDRLPAQDAGRDNSVINRQGMVLKRNQPSKITEAPIDNSKNIEQQRHDRALLATYSSAQEIDLARDRNLQTDQLAEQGLKQNLEAAKTRLAANQQTLQDLTARKKRVPPDLPLRIQSDQAEIPKLDTQIAQRQASMEATRQRFDSDKKRFNELKPAETPPETSNAATAAKKP